MNRSKLHDILEKQDWGDSKKTVDYQGVVGRGVVNWWRLLGQLKYFDTKMGTCHFSKPMGCAPRMSLNVHCAPCNNVVV